MELTQNIDNKTIDLQEVDFDPFAGPKLVKVIPTTQSQLEIWLSCIMGGDDANRSYNESISLKLKGDLNRQAIKSAINTLQDRHEILRSTFSPDGKSICIYKPFPVSHTYRDLSEKNPENQQKELDKLHKIDAESVFDLVRGPLLRTYLIKTTEQEHILKISAHHLVCDGWSFGIILENISAIYNSLVGNENIALETPIPYSHYAQEIQEHTSSNEYREIEAFWLNQYNDVPILNLPTDRVRPQVRTFKSHRADFSVPKSIIESLKSFGSKKKASLITTLIAAFESYLHLLTKQNDIVLGLPASGQSATGNYELVGHCVNLLPLRSKINGDESFMDYLDKRKSEIMDAYDHQQFTFSSLLQKLNIARDSSRIPLVPVIFNVDMGMDANVSFSGLEHELFSDPRAYENFEIFLNITGTEQKLNFEWSYNSLLFTSDTIEKMMSEFQSLLECLIAEPSIKIKDIHISRNRSLLRDLDQWNNTVVTYPKDKTVADLVNETAIRYPSKAAIIFNDQETTYTELNQQSNRIAHYLINQGVKENDIIALVADRSPEMIITLLGIIKSGAAYLPIDPQYPEGRIQFMLEDSGVKYALVSQTQQATLHTAATKLIIEDLLLSLQNTSSSYPSLNLTADRTAYVLYTSGSTGKPKGVQIKHPSLTNFLLSVQKEPGIKENDVLLAVSTISFDIAATEIFLPLISGASVYLADTNSTRDGRALFDIVQNKGISIMQATPLTWRIMLAAGWNQKLPLKVICTGEAFPKDLAETLLLKSSEVWNGYGPTEATIWASIKKLSVSDELITIGNPIANTQLYILDEHLSPVPLGTSGELYIAGDCLADGYLNRPDLSDQKFLPNPFKPGTKIYQTGDLGYRLPNGEVVCLGRADAQVKIRGHRIELGEIEYNLIQQAGIKEAVVVADGDDKDNQQLLAYVVPDEKDSSGWMERWDDLYTLGIKSEESVPLEDQNLDIAIISQYNNQEDIKEHGREWTQEGLKRIRALKAKKILELGTGGGHLLFELAPNAEKYIATDYSDVAISKLNDKLALNKERWKHVNAFRAPADDFSSIQEKDFDLIFFHGVVQYFPTLEYLVKVLETAVDHLRDGGCIHIGDSQTLSAISMHFATEQLALLQDQVSVDEFEKIVRYQTEKEEEISIDPGFFYFLPQLIPNITAVDVQIRGGDYSNEATKCHYDIWLYKGESVPRTVANDIVETWHERSSLESIDTLLSDHSNKVILIRDIPNQRVVKDYALSQIVRTLDKNDTVKTIKGKLRAINPTGINPTELWRLGEQRGFKTHIRWTNDASDGNIEVVFIPVNLGECLPDAPSQLVITSEKEYLRVKKDTVEILSIPDHQIHLWKNKLKAHLPEFMIPNALIALNRFPTTENGKIDRKSLPQPAKILAETQSSQAKPSNATEQLIHDLWCKHLDLTSVDIHSNFFELGGHSLIAVRLMLDLEKETGIRLPISALFQNSSIAKLAQKIVLNDEQKLSVQPSATSLESQTITAPTTKPQKEIWTSCILGGENANRAYNISYAQKLYGKLDLEILRSSIQELVNRHQSLRSTFNDEGTEIIINPNVVADYTFFEISNLSPYEQKEFIDKELHKCATDVLDLQQAPLFKAIVIQTSQDEHLFIISFHHIICDGFSTSIIMKELSEVYNAKLSGTNLKIAPAVSLSDFTNKTDKYYKSDEYNETIRFWIDQYQGETPVLNLPTDFTRPQKRTYNGARAYFHVANDNIKKLKALAFNNGCSSAILFRSIFEIFLSRICNQKTIITGLPVAGQLNEENTNLVGHCVNLLPLKTTINPKLTFEAYLAERRDSILEVYNHYNITFSDLLSSLKYKRDTSRLPLTPVFLNINSDKFEFEFINLKKETYPTKKLFETFEIALNIDDLTTEVVFRWDYNTDLFKSETIEEFQREFETLINIFSNESNIIIGKIATKHDKEYEALLKKVADWNSTQQIYPKDKNITAYIDEISNSYPSKTALTYNNQHITYQELNLQSNQFAHFLIGEGLKKGNIVAFMLDRGPEMIISLLGILKAGAAYLPLDPQFPSDRTDFMLTDSESQLIITSQKYLHRFKDKNGVITWENVEERVSQESDTLSVVSSNAHDLAYVLYTSGSTGKPKGVQIEMHSLVNFLLSMQEKPGISLNDKLLAVTTISFDIAGLELLLPLISGAEIVMADYEKSRNGVELLNLLNQSNANIMQATPITWYMLIECGWQPTTMFKALCGGENLPKDLIEKLLALGVNLWNMYGPTETTIWSSTKNITSSEGTITVGKPINNTEFYILDEEMRQVPTGTVGEIYIAGDGLARGYLNRPELTSEKFIKNPFSINKDARMYSTGDTGYFLDNGEVVCLGRMDSQVKIRGFRIELEEIEYNFNKLPGIKKCIVSVDKENPYTPQLRAYVLLDTEETKISADTVIEWKTQLKTMMPDYMIPTSITAVDKFPTTNNGKIDRKSLDKRKQNESQFAEKSVVKVKNELEETVARIWSEHLLIDQIDRNSNFFDLGGNSLLAIRTMRAIENETGIRVPISILFEHSTIKSVAHFLSDSKQEKKWQCLVPIKRTGTKSPLYLVHGGGFNILTFEPLSKHLDPDQPLYALQGLGLYDKNTLLPTVEEIAAFYINEMLENDPVGPYQLGGYCSGGILAYEMAAQLQAMGKKVSFLAMLDTNYDYPPLGATTNQLILRDIKNIVLAGMHLIKSSLLHPRLTYRYIRNEIEKKSKIFRTKSHISFYEETVNEAYEQAFKTYKGKPLNTKITLLKAKTRVFYVEDPKLYGWKKLALQGIDVHTMKGDHTTFLMPPNEKEFAKKLQILLN
ncbi:amino acid adenylation domain-containing protein [Albibacterium profundi]|uniref:Amino acid adenylation domain-containing protein n=1 Tax=Albibacterium profundi TaxID=3134906 RepID=A0ABV5CBE6_9SPHI